MKKIWGLLLLSMPALAEVGTNQEAVVTALTSNRVFQVNTCGDDLTSISVERLDENNFAVSLRYSQQ